MSRIAVPNNKAQVAGSSFFELLFLLFLGLKLTGYVDWSWWWITSPLWGPFAAFVGIVIVGFFVVALVHIVKALIPKQQITTVHTRTLRPV